MWRIYFDAITKMQALIFLRWCHSLVKWIQTAALAAPEKQWTENEIKISSIFDSFFFSPLLTMQKINVVRVLCEWIQTNFWSPADLCCRLQLLWNENTDKIIGFANGEFEHVSGEKRNTKHRDHYFKINFCTPNNLYWAHSCCHPFDSECIEQYIVVWMSQFYSM